MTRPRRSVRRLGPALVAVVWLAGVAVGDAGAVASVEAGWWTTSPVPLAPDADDDALVVQGGADQPVAYAAVSYELDDGERARTLTLHVQEDSSSTPASTLEVCPLTEAFTPVQGGSADRAPAYDCAEAVAADPSDDGTAYRWDVSAFESFGALSVAVLSTELGDRVVLDAPTVADLSTTLVTTGGGGDGAEFGSGTGSDAAVTTTAPPARDTSDGAGSFTPAPPRSSGLALDPRAGPAGGAATDDTETDEAPTPPADTGEDDAPRRAVAGSDAPATEQVAAVGPAPGGAGDDESSPLAWLVLVALAGVAAGLWFAAGRSAGETAGAEEASLPA